MAKQLTTIGMLLLVGAVFVSLNALAVSARPGDVSQAEKTTSVANATAGMPQVAGSGTVAPTAGVVPVPLPLPATTPIAGPAVAPSPWITPPSANLTPAGNLSVAPGINSPSPGAAPPIAPGGDGVVHSGLAPIPIPPVTPRSAKGTPVPVPPYRVDPARDGL